MKTILLTTALFLTACNAPVYYVSGSLESTVPPDACKGLLTFSEFESARTHARSLIHEATHSEDLRRLKSIAAELDSVIQKLKGTLTEEYSRETYQGTYTWRMEKPKKLKFLSPSLEPILLSVNGREVPAKLLRSGESRDEYHFEWTKPMSALEYCTLSGSTIGLIELRSSFPPSLNYLRLYYEKDEPNSQEEEPGSAWPASTTSNGRK